MLVSEDILRVKLAFDNPIVIVGGDVNQFDISKCTHGHADFTVITPLNTRAQARLDQLVCNCIESITENETIPALETPEGIKSDHLGVYNSYQIKRFHQFKVKKYQIRKIMEKGKESFINEFRTIDWQPIYELQGADARNEFFFNIVSRMIDKLFPIKSFTVKKHRLALDDRLAAEKNQETK